VRQPASQCSVSMPVTFMQSSRTLAATYAEGEFYTRRFVEP
jgi:hypothetical protein